MAIQPARSLPPSPVRRMPPVAQQAARPALTSRAKAGASEERLRFDTVDGYKNAVIKWVAYVREARQAQATAARNLADARREESTASDAISAPVKAAEQALAIVERQYRAPVERLVGELEAAQAALDAAVNPGKSRALALESQADQLAREIGDNEASVRSLRSRIESADARSSSYRWEVDGLNRQIEGLQADNDRLSSRRFALIAQASQERGRQNPYDSPAVVAGRARVKALTESLEQAQGALRDQTAPGRDRLDAAQQRYNLAMSAARAKVSEAERQARGLDTATQEAVARFDRLPTEVGLWRRLVWKLTVHFDAKRFWQEQKALADR